MFHANAWATAYALPMVGAKMVMPGPKLDGESVFELMDAEGVTQSAGVPTVWMMLINTMRAKGRKPEALRRILIGGSACPRAMIVAFEEEFGIEVYHAWGMTETSPLGSVGMLKPSAKHLTGAALYDQKAKQGSAPFGVEMIITDDAGKHLPWDGKTFGKLKVRGPCITKSYYRREDDQGVLDAEGYFDTNDIATIAPDGTMTITDRAKDVIKSGGEWISSIEIENLAVGHPDVAEAAVIGMHHPKWDERPLLVIVPTKGRTPAREDVLDFLSDKIAKWWMPDDVQFVDEIPHTAAGKINKLGLRQQFKDKDYRLPA
jgi:fatty-acyl-CoA synthase